MTSKPKPESANIQPIQFQEFFARCMGNQEFAHRILNKYVDDSKISIGQLECSIADDDLPGIKNLAHKIKGSSANIEARQMAELCDILESDATIRLSDESAAETATNRDSFIVSIKNELTRIEQFVSDLSRNQVDWTIQ